MRPLLACVVLVATASGTGSAQMPADSVIERIIRDRVETGRSTGIVVGVMDSDGSQRVVSWPNQLSGVSLDGRAVFEVGSIAKVFTATLLAEMVQRGEVSCEDPVSDYLPSGVQVPRDHDQPVTLCDLAMHLSGLPSTPANLSPADPTNPFAEYTLENLYEFLRTYEPASRADTRWSYSNTGVAILGQALSRRADASFESLLEERVLTPLSLEDTTPVPDAALAARIVPGHDVSGNPVRNWEPGVFAPAGGLWSTADDLLRFVAANLSTDTSSLGRALASTHAARHVISPQASMALGWIRYTENGDSLVWHAGETGGYHAFVGFNPSAGNGVVVLSSSRTTIDDIGFHLLLPSSPLEDPLAHIIGRTAVSLPAGDMERYVGQYVFPSGTTLTIRIHQGKLFALSRGTRFQLHAEAPDRFFVYDFPADIAFEAGSDGMITHLVSIIDGNEQRARRVQP